MAIQTTVRRAAAALLLWMGLGLGQGLAANAAESLTFAVVPQFPPEQIYRTWKPVLDEIATLSGQPLELKTYPSIPDFEAAFIKGEPDIAFMNPYHMIMANKAAGYLPIIRDDAQRLTGILVVRKDSPVTSLKQLDGASLAFPAPNAFGASLYMRALLTEEARINFTPLYVKTHSNVFRHVLAGRALAGGAIQKTLDQETPEVQAQLRVLYVTPPVFPHPIATHPRLPAKVRDAIQKAFLALAARKEFEATLADIQLPKPVKADYGEYATLEKLGLQRYVVLKEE